MQIGLHLCVEAVLVTSRTFGAPGPVGALPGFLGVLPPFKETHQLTRGVNPSVHGCLFALRLALQPCYGESGGRWTHAPT